MKALEPQQPPVFVGRPADRRLFAEGWAEYSRRYGAAAGISVDMRTYQAALLERSSDPTIPGSEFTLGGGWHLVRCAARGGSARGRRENSGRLIAKVEAVDGSNDEVEIFEERVDIHPKQAERCRLDSSARTKRG